MNAQAARDRANAFEARLQRRLAELGRERQLSPQRPVVVGAALVSRAASSRVSAATARGRSRAVARSPQAHRTARR